MFQPPPRMPERRMGAHPTGPVGGQQDRSSRRRGFDPDEHVRRARKRRSPEEIVTKLRQVEALRLRGKTCAEAVRSIGVSEVTYRRWRAELAG